jgi:hypothetical protein
MNKFLFLFIFCVACIGCNNNLNMAQNSPSGRENRDSSMVLFFYKNYCTYVSYTQLQKGGDEKADSLTKKYCSEKLYNELKMKDSLDGDPFINGQIFFPESLKNLVVKVDTKNSNQYLVSVRIKVTVVNHRIDTVTAYY